MKILEFEAVASGDGESPCWDVDAETFKRLEGREPDQYDASMMFAGLFSWGEYDAPTPSGMNQGEWLKVRVEDEDTGDWRRVKVAMLVTDRKPAKLRRAEDGDAE